jgi:hypothetical protein
VLPLAFAPNLLYIHHLHDLSNKINNIKESKVMSFNEMDPRNSTPVSFHDPVMPNFLASSCETLSPQVLPNPRHEFERDDDMDIMLLHADFPKLIEFAAGVKRARQVLNEAPASPKDVRSALSGDEVLRAVSRMQDQLLRNSHAPKESIERGRYPIIDSTIDDAMQTLQKEWDHLSHWIDSTLVTTPTVAKESPKKQGRAKKEAIAVKYSMWQTNILMTWMINHIDQPFPDPDEVESLMLKTGLLQTQIVNWTTNVRKRNRKATCEGSKKPHHFLDFLFLVQNREDQKKAEDSASSRRSASPPTAIRSSGRVTRNRHAQLPIQRMAKQSPTAKAYPKGRHVSMDSSALKKAPKAKAPPKPKAPPKRKGKSKRDDHKDDLFPFLPEWDMELIAGIAKTWLSGDDADDILPSVTEDSADLRQDGMFPAVFPASFPESVPFAAFQAFPEAPPPAGPAVFPEVAVPEGAPSLFPLVAISLENVMREEIGDFQEGVGFWATDRGLVVTDQELLVTEPGLVVEL